MATDRTILDEYRVTRPESYKLGCPGWADASARQGYYYFSDTQEGAHREAQADFPGERLDVQLVRRGEGRQPKETISFAYDLTLSFTFKDGANDSERSVKLIKTLLENHPDVHHATVKVHRG